MSDIRPFLSSLASASPARAFGAALPVIDTPAGTSPWSPQPRTAPAPSAPAVDVTAVHDEAAARGREEGLRETAALRARLQQMIDSLADAELDANDVRAHLIAEAATTVVDAWVGGKSVAEKFLPIIRAWQTRSGEPATAYVHPSEVESVRAALGEASMTVTADPSLAVGTMRVSSAGLELTHSWEQRLTELREAIVTAIEVSA